MAGGNGVLANDVLRWKTIGAAVWAAAIMLLAAAALAILLSPAALLSPTRLLAAPLSLHTWLAATTLVLAQAPAFVGAAVALRAREPCHVATHRLLHLPRAAPASVLLGKLAARLGSLSDAARTSAFLALHAASAALTLPAFTAARGGVALGASWTLQYGFWLAAAYLAHWAYCSQDVLAFPTVQRHRYFRLKQRLPGAAARAALLAGAALGPAAASAALCAPGAAALAPRAAAATLAAGALCAFGWLAASAALDVVFGERLRPGDYDDRDALRGMAACLAGARGDLMQALALHDASLLAGDVGAAAARRAALFSDETGERWKPVAAACIAELDALSATVGTTLQQSKPAGGGGAPAGASQSHKWNVLPAALSSKGGLGGSRQQLRALLAARAGYPRAALAARALAGFACASLKEDRYGVLQLTQPGLGEAVMCMLSALGATQQLMRATASLAPRQLDLGPWRGSGDGAAWAGCFSSPAADAAACALQDALTVSLYRTTDAFGGGLAKVLAECKSSPAFGSAPEAAALLQLFLRGQA